MNQFTVEVPMMADVLATIRSDSSIARRDAMISALHSVERWSGRSLREIPANLTQLRLLFDATGPAVLGIAPQTFANVKSLCLAALKASELVPGMMRNAAVGRPTDPAWLAIWPVLTTLSQRSQISRLASWCRRHGIHPEKVDDNVIDDVMTEMAATSFRQNQHRVRRNMTMVWNHVVEALPHLDLQKVTIPPTRLRRTQLPLDMFPASFLEDWNGFARWAHGEDVFADDARPKPLKLTTLDMIFRYVHSAATALVETGVAVSEIRSLADLVTRDAFKAILRHRFEKAGGKATSFNTYMAVNLIQIAKDWVKVDEDALAELKRLKAKLPRPSFTMTRKNKLLVTNFDDSRLKERLLSAPERLWQDLKCTQRYGRWQLAQAQAALGINILTYLPVRLGNLCTLAFDEHLVMRDDGRSTLALSADETKTGAGVEYEIPTALVQRLTEYREVIAPAVIGRRPKHLFCDLDDNIKTLATTRYLIQRYLKLYVGIHMNPHAFRHLAAKFILDNNPGAHVVVQHLLGHKKLATTANYYAGVDTLRAGRHHQELLERSIVERAANGRAGKAKHRAA